MAIILLYSEFSLFPPEKNQALRGEIMDEAWRDHHHARNQTWKAVLSQRQLPCGRLRGLAATRSEPATAQICPKEKFCPGAFPRVSLRRTLPNEDLGSLPLSAVTKISMLRNCCETMCCALKSRNQWQIALAPEELLFLEHPATGAALPARRRPFLAGCFVMNAELRKTAIRRSRITEPLNRKFSRLIVGLPISGQRAARLVSEA